MSRVPGYQCKVPVPYLVPGTRVRCIRGEPPAVEERETRISLCLTVSPEPQSFMVGHLPVCIPVL